MANQGGVDQLVILGRMESWVILVHLVTVVMMEQ